ncbi:MAG: hypothetical protein HN353_02650 [Bdellovibrionales bacterium]|jgi:hypothetical protein|nr:hypothetical protein [Bdellovibrionales bacterium]MBT3525586.1 hypothetical protein [Bdellovibrionales bacterium]MBT7765677.1 hypothetical protein [Bdellovibrionales bacterium]
MSNLEEKVLSRLNRRPEKKERYNFTLQPSVKRALASWCKEKGHKESAALEAMLLEMLPNKFLNKYKEK